jgi:predicted nucleic acid-binding protein
MNDRFFLDTNVVFYLFDPSSPRKADQTALLLRQGLTTRKGAISYQVVQEFFNVAYKRSQGPMRLEEAEQFFFDGSSSPLRGSLLGRTFL